MKQIIAVIRPHQLDKVEEALHQLEHFPGFTLMQANGHARGAGLHHSYVSSTADWLPHAHERLVLLMFCGDTLAQSVVDVISSASRTGNPGDGMIAVTNLDSIVRIRTGERSEDAV